MKQVSILIMTLVLPILARAETVEIDGIWYYLLDGDTIAEVTRNPSGDKYSGNILIPDKVIFKDTDYSVNKILDYAFSNCVNMTSIRIPDGVKSIGNSAFLGCTGLTSITIPRSLETIGIEAFSYCSGLNTIEVERGNEIYDSREKCNAIIETANNKLVVGCTKTIIPQSVTSIGNLAFNGCDSLTSIIIPNSVTTIYEGAFLNCSGLTSIDIPNSVIEIGEGAFENCSNLTRVNISDLEAWCNIHFIGYSSNPLNMTSLKYNRIGYLYINNSAIKDLIIPSSVKEIKNCTFSGCNGLSSVSLHNEVTSIGSGAFAGCSGITSIEIPSCVTNIGNGAFSGCSSLSEVSIPHGIKYLGYSTFQNCYNLTHIEIPNTVTFFDDDAFSGCTNLTSITFPKSLTGIGSRVFDKCNNLCSVYISDLESWCKIKFENPSSNPFYYSQQYFKTHLYLNNSEITNVVIPDGIRIISQYAFLGCNSLLSIDIPESVDYIAHDAFEYCSSLTAITISKNVNYVGKDAFMGCSGLTSVTIPNSIIEIEDETFSGCSSLVSVEFPDNLTYIGTDAFRDCRSLASVTIPSKVTKIGLHPFSNCSNLSNIKVESGNHIYDSRNDCNALIETFSNTLIAGCSNTIIPNNIKTIESEAFYGCCGLKDVTIPSSVKNIGNDAFANCSGLESIIVESGNTIYDSRNNCNAINETSSNTLIVGCKNTIISNNIQTIGMDAFKGCGLTYITIPKSVSKIQDCAFSLLNIQTVVSQIEYPFEIRGKNYWYGEDVAAFSYNTFDNATLYVPTGSLKKYKTTAGWKDFQNIKEGAENIINSMADAIPQTLKIESNDGSISIIGTHVGIPISVYNISGQEVGSAIASSSAINISTTLRKGDIAIVKIGDKTFKVLMK